MQQGPQGFQQAAPKKGMPTWLIVLIILGVILVTGFVGCAVCVGAGAKAVSDSIASASASSKAADDAAKAAKMTVQIKQLLDDYKNNEVRADETYKGKYVQTTGFVQDVKKDLMDSMYITLVPSKEGLHFPVVQCFPADTEKDAAAKLNKGDAVAIEGKVDGLFMNVLVRNCTIKGTKAPGEPAKKAPTKK